MAECHQRVSYPHRARDPGRRMILLLKYSQVIDELNSYRFVHTLYVLNLLESES